MARAGEGNTGMLSLSLHLSSPISLKMPRVDAQTLRLAKGLVWASELLSTPFEKHFTPENSVGWAADHYVIPVVLVSLYLAFCFFGQQLMRNFNAFDLRLPLAGWNAFLCLFSFLGMCRTVS